MLFKATLLQRTEWGENKKMQEWWDIHIPMLEPLENLPWAGAGGRYAIPQVLEQVRNHNTTLIFHNTRAQAEIFFHELWLQNEEVLPIAIHHASLDREQRQKVEQAMVNGELRAVVCTGSLDLGIDWGTSFENTIVSEKDMLLQPLKDFASPF